MIVALYESDYPVNLKGTPDWEVQPIGYFDVPTYWFAKHLSKEIPTVNGRFIFCYGPKPRIGEHLLAAFAHEGQRYLYNSTLSYSGSESQTFEKEEWSVGLGLHALIREW